MLEEEKRERFENVRLTRGIYHPQHRPTTFPAGRSFQGSKTSKSLHGVTQTEGAAHPRQLMASFTHHRQMSLALNEKRSVKGCEHLQTASKAGFSVGSLCRHLRSIDYYLRAAREAFKNTFALKSHIIVLAAYYSFCGHQMFFR